jgi:hypothetical protein
MRFRNPDSNRLAIYRETVSMSSYCSVTFALFTILARAKGERTLLVKIPL